MNFVNTQYIPQIIAGIIGFSLVLAYLNHKYFNWVKTYWFFERSWMSRIAAFLYIVSIGLMLTSLLDLRGPEERVKSALPDQRTIIILDSSASMLAEDVRPSRFSKAIQLARHFVKNAAGHQVSVVLFSDIQKRLIPFTDDIDLLDSRLAAMDKTNSVSGGSNISQAISEALGYFDFDGDKKSATGNILVFTDAEESEDGMDVELGNNINLAVVGIGTAKGGNIPLRWEDGSFRGYKTQKGEPVTTKLDEAYIKKIGKNVKNYKYWIANSYSLPTDEIMSFFRGTYNKAHGKGDMRIRPVFSHLILIPAIIIYCLSVVFGRFGSFKKVLSMAFILFSFAGIGTSYAQEEKNQEVKKLPPSLIKDMDKMKRGKADRKEVLKIAENLLKNNEDQRANELYSEYAKSSDEEEVLFNRATALLKTNRLNEALPLVQEILKNSKSETTKDRIRHNLLLAMNNENGGQSNKQDDKKNKDNKQDNQDKQDKKDKQDDKEQKDDKNKDGKGNQDSKEKKDDKKQEGKDSKENKDNKDGKGNKDQQKKDNNEGQGKEEKEKKDPKDLEKPERKESKPQSLEEKEKMIEQKRRMIKTPAMVKQIMSDDRELQKRMMDTSTNQRGGSKPKRDW